MKLYIAHCIDRHIDPVIRVFDTFDGALGFVKDWLQKETANTQRQIEEDEVDGWLYYASYSSEDDHVYVTETTLNDAS